METEPTYLRTDQFYSLNFSNFYYWPFTSGHGNGNLTIQHEPLFHDIVNDFYVDYQKWIFSICACSLVGLSGIFPLLIFPVKSSSKKLLDPSATAEGDSSDKTEEPRHLKRLLCFAVGSLLGDVFLHLLPEAWSNARESGESSHGTMLCMGFWVLAGLVSFVICEMLVSSDNWIQNGAEDGEKKPSPNNNVNKCNQEKDEIEKEKSLKHITGYLNLIANGFDNFAHGLAVAGSFIISCRIGILTTLAILLHEIPHEIGDFAILLRSGFDPWSAAKAQLYTATIGLVGAIFTLSIDCMRTLGNFTWWILPFTSGGFINIALTNLLPDLLEEDDPKECFKQLVIFGGGIGVMALVSLWH